MKLLCAMLAQSPFACRNEQQRSDQPSLQASDARPKGSARRFEIAQRVPPRGLKEGASAADGGARLHGKALYAAIRAECRDDNCRFSRCGQHCLEWMHSTYGQQSFKNVQLKNRAYLACTGACMDPNGK